MRFGHAKEAMHFPGIDQAYKPVCRRIRAEWRNWAIDSGKKTMTAMRKPGLGALINHKSTIAAKEATGE